MAPSKLRDAELVDVVKLEEMREGLHSGFWRRSLCDYNRRFKAKVKFILGKGVDGPTRAPIIVSQTAHIKSWESSDPMTTGSTVWDAALLLSMHLESQSSLVEKQRVLELGSGTGVAGLIARRLGASEVVLTDLPSMLPLLETNIKLNFSGASDMAAITARPLVWQDARQDSLLAGGHEFDCVLMSDVLYHAPQYSPLLAVLTALADLHRGSAPLRFLWSQEIHHPDKMRLPFDFSWIAKPPSGDEGAIRSTAARAREQRLASAEDTRP
eukprot:TRINITY_DN18706_c0_g1_i1.p1 TRINITY_DN18706_c0_g1~~TRINITY_DN18706_c0_g1_i1.p1  ORF type:complete len:276 (-),score=53.85 TRINITY_DN18706_c0_g1_i1:131-937(-)